jgi:hypothetical protein
MRGVCTWGGKVGSVVQGCVCVWLGGGAKGGPRVNEAGRAFAVRWIKGAQQTVFFCRAPWRRHTAKKSLSCAF